MRYRKIADEAGLVSYALIFDPGDEAFAELGRFARDTGVNGASLSGVGGASSAVVGWFDFDRKHFERIPIDEQVEVLSLLGDIATTEEGTPQVHAHVVLGCANGHTRGGHLLALRVRPTLEVIVTETPAHLRKRSVPNLPIATIRVDENR
jgi:predicted DNA-binding protein with PD1-like motif